MVQQMRLALRSPKHYFASKKTVSLILQGQILQNSAKAELTRPLTQNNSAPYTVDSRATLLAVMALPHVQFDSIAQLCITNNLF